MDHIKIHLKGGHAIHLKFLSIKDKKIWIVAINGIKDLYQSKIDLLSEEVIPKRNWKESLNADSINHIMSELEGNFFS